MRVYQVQVQYGVNTAGTRYVSARSLSQAAEKVDGKLTKMKDRWPNPRITAVQELGNLQ